LKRGERKILAKLGRAVKAVKRKKKKWKGFEGGYLLGGGKKTVRGGRCQSIGRRYARV